MAKIVRVRRVPYGYFASLSMTMRDARNDGQWRTKDGMRKNTQGEVFTSENRLLADTSKGAHLLCVTAASGKTSDLRRPNGLRSKKDKPQKRKEKR